RKLAMKYHPDHNKASTAESKFQEITMAYHYLLESHEDEGMQDYITRTEASEIIKRERQKVWEYAQKQRRKKEEAEAQFKASWIYDVLILLKYAFHGLVLLFSLAAVVTPIILAIVIEPAVLAATVYFIIIGAFLLWYIYEKRKTWFRLGSLNTLKSKLLTELRMPNAKASKDHCCYTSGGSANGSSYTIGLIKILDIKVATFGALNHEAKYERKMKKVVMPRSLKAQFWHRACSYIKIMSILTSAIFFPVSSYMWRIIAGMILGGIISFLVLKIVGVRSKTSYLFTSALIFKLLVWIGALLSISYFGPGFDISLTGYILLVLGGLFFLLDMVFDLLFGLFPFYKKMQKPVIAQGKILNSLYIKGYQNFMEYPVYSILYPLFKWLF
ncbi:J domain-containing protein, partial [Bacteroidota bacterium]